MRLLLAVLLLYTNFCKISFSTTKVTCPSYCKCFISSGMRSAKCTGQRMPNIDTGVPNRVQILDISNNSISTLESEEFKKLGLTSLYKLKLQFNHIGAIDLHAFAGVTELRILDLSYNHLYYLLPATFEATPNLRSLYLQGNRLKLSSAPFLIMSSLEILDLSSCQLDRLEPENFSKLPALISLNLTHNQLIRVETNVLEKLNKLQKIYLSRNPWSCDGKTRQLEVWLKMKNIQHDPLCTNNKEDKFQRMSSITNFQNDTELISDDDLLRLWSSAKQDTNSDLRLKVEHECGKTDTSILSGGLLFKFFDKIPSFWSFLIGFEIGAVIGGLTMIIIYKIYKPKNSPSLSRSRGRSLQSLQNRTFLRLRSTDEDSTVLWTELDTINCPDTPPPAYRDCFESTIVNNNRPTAGST